ncbi:MAG: peptidoglycan DD-metalloendopeptidase family protein, partial [Candidatus Levybacteria bacterium]|nr:peptidoglycan DD-metalloendopeptidase family protein [Candidatus Levybacteria bacterium]
MLKTLLVVLLFIFICLNPLSIHAQLQSDSNTVTTRVGNPIITDSGWPVQDRSMITQGTRGPYGHDRLYGLGLQSLDIANVAGTPIFSTFDGVVTTACNDGQTSCNTYSGCNYNGCGYGKHVVVTSEVNGQSAQVFFGHFSQIQVQQGQTVTKGTQLGLMGTTGFSTGVHLHWEFRNLAMAQPNIPNDIVPAGCDSGGPQCSPLFIPTAESLLQPQNSYWFLLHRQSNREELFRGVPGDTSQSTLIKTFNVKTGRPGERPTPLPQLAGEDYWVITSKEVATTDETAPYFLTLNIPVLEPYYGPIPYNECSGAQCDWILPGAFGLHGVNGDNSRLSSGNPGSSGCIRHTNEDITYLYNL